jgi:hypothetical protein
MKESKSFILHKDSLDILNELTDEQAGQLFKAIWLYQNGEQIELSPLLRIAFTPFKNQFGRDVAAYQERCQKNSDNAKKRWEKNATVCDRIGAVAKDAYSDSDSKKDSKSKNKKDSKSNIDAFAPNDASLHCVNSVYPNCDVNSLVDNFKDQARNRAKPFKDLQSGFRNYVNKGWVKPVSKTNTELSYSEITQRLKQERENINSGNVPLDGLVNKMRIM